MKTSLLKKLHPDFIQEVKERVAIFIPVPDRPGRFYVKKRVAPWLTGDQRPEYLGNWSQFGVPATIWFTNNPPNAQETWLCEGEWDWEMDENNRPNCLAQLEGLLDSVIKRSAGGEA